MPCVGHKTVVIRGLLGCCGTSFYINNFRATTITIANATTTNNDIKQHEPAEKRAECQVSDHSSVGSEVGEGLSAWGGILVVDAHAPVECVGLDTYSSCPCTCWA